MQPLHSWKNWVGILLFGLLPGLLPAQKGISFDIKKPPEYEERVLRSEKSDQKKFTLPRRFFQNLGTHYNYFFNARNKINEVLDRARLAWKDDYSQLLAFYNYSLDATAADSVQLDSIVYKSSSGIALHDLRNDWVDNLYILWGESYFLQKKFDSAFLMFQFINYAFAPKEKDGYYLTIGSNRDGNNAYSISTREKRSLPRRLLTEPPSRNDAFIWQIRNFLAQDLYAEAASLIVTLRNDPQFPKRLQSELHEVQAHWFYKQNMWDSAAAHLSQALDAAVNLAEKTRWEYLAAQLYEKAGQYQEAEKFYLRVSRHTTDPVLDIYARLATVRVNRDGGDKTLEKNVATLMRMAKQDKYTDYRDIIYYMAAQMQVEGGRLEEAMALLKKSTQFPGNGESLRNKAFLQLAEMSLARQQYREAYNFYDSIKLSDPTLKNPKEIEARKASLNIIAASLEIIERQDSLQRIAALPEDQRKDFVRKLVRDLRRRQGLKDDGGGFSTGGSGTQSPDLNTLFPPPNTRGEWYFYNEAAKTRGQNEFKRRWGTRPNQDNWRRSAVLLATIRTPDNNPAGAIGKTGGDAGSGTAPEELSFESLYDKLPLTPEQLDASNDSIQLAMLTLATAYIQNLEDCGAGVRTLQDLKRRFPDTDKMPDILFQLQYCARRSGDSAMVRQLQAELLNKYGNSEAARILQTGYNPASGLPRAEATRTYERIYDLFIEGKFTEAVAEKKTADSLFGKNYWSPQLLYIESVYYIRQREDSTAVKVLNDLISQFAGHALVPKATNLMNVLRRRAQIEEELSRLQVTRLPEDTVILRPDPVKPRVTQPAPDSVRKTAPVTPPPATVTPPVVKTTDTTARQQPVTPPPVAGFRSEPASAHFAVVLLNKVDPVFVNEARNAFARYNREQYYNKTFTQELGELDAENRLLLIAPFANAEEALAWVGKASPVAASEIVPWLKGGKFSFLIISENNLAALQQNKDLEGYRRFLQQQFPGKF